MSECSGVSGEVRTEGVGASSDTKDDEEFRTYLIHSTTSVLLVDQILSLMPPQRNVILSMNEYPVYEVNPLHPNEQDSPTHVIIFCIRFIADDIFQPIGGLLIYKHLDQSAVLAECVKAYINDLWKLGLYVVATVSPAFRMFKAIISSIAKIEDCDTYSDVITYSVYPIKEIIHIYDIQFLLVKLQTLLKDGDVRFEEENDSGKEVYEASWRDMSAVFNSYVEFKRLADFFTNNDQIPRRVHIFTEQIYEFFLETEEKGILSSKSKGFAVLLNCVRSFLRFTEQDLVELKNIVSIQNWSGLLAILRTMTFRKSKFRTCTKEKIPAVPQPFLNPSLRRRIDFSGSEFNTGARKKENVEVLPESPAKSKSKKSKKKKKSSAKAEPEKAVHVTPEMTFKRKKKLEKIQELCEILKSTGSLENVATLEQNEPAVETNICKTELTADVRAPETEKNCDTDKNNNSDESMHENQDKLDEEVNSDKPVEVGMEIEGEIKNYENVPQGSSQIEEKKTVQPSEGETLNEIRFVSKFVDGTKVSPENKFHSKSDEETETSINRSCDKIPNIIKLLGDVDIKDKPEKPPDSLADEYERNPVTNEMLTTIFGTYRLLRLLEMRRIKVAKPDAFIVEHIDYLVTKIQEKNMMKPNEYYGHNYEFFNSTLAFATLENTNSLFLVSKD